MNVTAVSIVIPTYQRRDALARLLRSLEHQTLPPAEVIVIVDGSTDGTTELLAGFRAPYPLTWEFKPNGGRASACNAGIARARGTLILLLDDDMVAAPTLLEAHVSQHRDGARRAVIGAAPVPLPAGSSAAALYVGRKFNRHLEKLAKPGRPVGLRDFYSGNLSIRRDVIVGIGGFDEAFRCYGHEDVEFSHRLRMADVQITFSGAAVAHQQHDKDFTSLAHDNFEKGQTAVLLARKHPTIANQLRLATVDLGSFRRRTLIGGLVTLSRVCPATRNVMVWVMSAMGAVRPNVRERTFAIALDYFFWLGARTAIDGSSGWERRGGR